MLEAVAIIEASLVYLFSSLPTLLSDMTWASHRSLSYS